jgi:hypothetical protein
MADHTETAEQKARVSGRGATAIHISLEGKYFSTLER